MTGDGAAGAPRRVDAALADAAAPATPEPVRRPDRDHRAGSWARGWARLDRNGLRVFWVVAAVALVLQLGLFLGVSTFRFHRFDLYTDFGTYAQAFSVIAHGHLDPFDTFQTYPFWQNHFELAMWPIALLGSIWPHPIVLLWLQDLAVVATELIALLWIGQICVERVGVRRAPVALLALVATVANAWWWEATIFDVHFETLGMPLALLCAYALWQGRFRTAWVAAVLAVLFGDVVALSILFVGLAGLLSARVRAATAGCGTRPGWPPSRWPGWCWSPWCTATSARRFPSTTAGSSMSRRTHRAGPCTARWPGIPRRSSMSCARTPARCGASWPPAAHSGS